MSVIGETPLNKSGCRSETNSPRRNTEAKLIKEDRSKTDVVLIETLTKKESHDANAPDRDFENIETMGKTYEAKKSLTKSEGA